jgi:hypothetical protein
MQLLIQQTRNRRVADKRADGALTSWRTTMTKWIALGAAAALITGISIASAQTASTPGAGSPGQDQSGATATGSAQTPGQPKVKDKPPSQNTTGAAPKMGPPKAPSASDKNSIHQSGGDRDSRGLPKQ